VDDLEFHKSILMAILIAPNELSCSWHHMGLSKPILLTKMDEGSLVFCQILWAILIAHNQCIKCNKSKDVGF
jgi:hypothetical protein